MNRSINCYDGEIIGNGALEMSESQRPSWRAYLVELSIVFIGLSGALFLDSWRNQKQDISQRQKYLTGVSADLNSDLAWFTQTTQLAQSARNQLDDLIQQLGQPESPPYTPQQIFQKLAPVAYIYEFTPNTTTYEMMKYSGQLDLIDDYDLRARLVAYHLDMNNVALSQNVLKEITLSYALPFLFEHTDLGNGTMNDATILASPYFKNFIIGYKISLDQYIATVARISDTCTTLNTQLKNKL